MPRPLALGIALLVVASGVAGVASAGTASSAASSNPSPLSASASQQSASANGAAANRTARGPLEFDLVRTSNCGIACRDVTVRVTNLGDKPVNNVRVATQLKAGDNVVWQGTERIQRLKPGQSKTSTKRVRLGPFDILSVRQNGGFLTADTTVTWNGGRETFTERRKVA